MSSGLKRRETFQRVISVQFQKPASLMVWGCISAYGMGSLHVLEGTMNAERYIKGFRATYAPLQDNHHFREGLVYFSRTMQNQHYCQLLQQHRLRSRRVGCWCGLPADQIPFTYREHLAPSFNQKIRQGRPRTLQQLETYIRQEWTKFQHQNSTNS